MNLKKWGELLDNLNIGGNNILMGDMNAKSNSWNCESNDQQGKILEEALDERNLVVLNESTISRIPTSDQASSNLDIIIASPQWVGKSQINESFITMGSDHQIINWKIQWESTIDIRTLGNRSNRLKLNSEKIDWKKWNNEFEIRKPEIERKIEEIKEWNDKYEEWKKQIKEIAIKAMKKKEDRKGSNREERKEFSRRGRPKQGINNTETEDQNRRRNKLPEAHTSKPRWWDESCEKQKKEIKSITKKIRNNPTTEATIILKELRKKWKATIQKKKNEAWQKLTEEIGNNANLSKVWKKVRQITKAFEPSSSNIEINQWNDLEDGEINKIKKRNETNNSKIPDTQAWTYVRDMEQENKWNKEITIHEMQGIINGNKKKKSAPGADGIDYEIIYKLPEYMKNILFNFYRFSWQSGWMPNDWKEGLIILIEKPGKAALRPITLTSCVGKTLKKIINKRINLWAEKNKIIEDNQSGFRKQKSTMDNLNILTMNIKESLRKNEKALGIFLDIEGAYDNVDY